MLQREAMHHANGNTYLQNATPDQLLAAIAANHCKWFRRMADAAGGSSTTTAGVPWYYRPGDETEVMIAFPQLSPQTAASQLDTLLAACYTIPDLQGMGYWALHEELVPADLSLLLVARGFEIGWQPHWMALDLQQWEEPAGLLSDVRVILIEDELDPRTFTLTYHSAQDAQRLDILAQARPRRIWHFGAWHDEHLVGHVILNMTTGDSGVAGIFSVGVDEAVRQRGIGTAVMTEALRFVQAQGCRYAVLNSTPMGESLYRRLGFRSLGYGQTWWLNRATLQQGPPAPSEVALAEAVGHGDLATLDRLADGLSPTFLDAPLHCGMTPIQLAIAMHQPESVTWLEQHGATLDLLSAWQLGWKDRAAELLRTTPELVDRVSGKAGTTPLHEAVLRDDVELVEFLLGGHPDLNREDANFHSTPLGWARHLGREHIAQILEQEEAAREGSSIP